MNDQKTIFAVSDVHGHATLLKEALDKAGYDKENPEHLLVCCGDYFDRGTENRDVLKFFERAHGAVLLRGNHEDMLLEIFRTGRIKGHNFLNGTVETLVEFFGSYAIDGDTLDTSGNTRMLDRVEEFINSTADYFETEHYIFTHGWLPTVIRAERPRIDPAWREATPERWVEARWSKWTEMALLCDRPDKTLVCGHVPAFRAASFNPSIEPNRATVYHGDGFIAIDGGTYTSGEVSVLVVKDTLLP